MTTRTMRLASGFLDSLSASETAPSLDVRGPITRRPCIHLYALVLWRIGSEFRSYVRTLGAQPAQSVRRFRDKIYLAAARAHGTESRKREEAMVTGIPLSNSTELFENFSLSSSRTLTGREKTNAR